MREQDVEISVLGSMAVRVDDVEIDLGPKLRRLLAALVVRHGSVVSTDRLIDSVWQGEPPEGADRSVKTYVTRLRRAIDPERKGLEEITGKSWNQVVAAKDKDVFLLARIFHENLYIRRDLP